MIHPVTDAPMKAIRPMVPKVVKINDSKTIWTMVYHTISFLRTLPLLREIPIRHALR